MPLSHPHTCSVSEHGIPELSLPKSGSSAPSTLLNPFIVPFSLVLGSVVIIDSVHPPLPAPLHPNHPSEGGFQLGDSCLQSFCCSQFHLGMQWGEGTEGTGWEGTQTARAARSVGKHPDPFPCSQMPGTAWLCLADGTIECLEFCQLKMCKLEVISVPIKSQNP